jgi:hypothetical protein
MAPNVWFRIKLFVLLLALCLAAFVTPARGVLAAQEGRAAPAAVPAHAIKFYLDPKLVPDPGFAEQALAKYVEDINFVLQKNTGRQLVFDPATGIVLAASQPHADWATPPLPVEGFEIWAHAVYTGAAKSHGGYAGIDPSGAGVLAGLKWTRLYDPDQLTGAQVGDYWTQINNMLHELAHVFGAGYGEYYRLAHIEDTTGVAPLLNIDVNDPNDPFWSDKPDFKTDPLLWNAVEVGLLGASASRAALLDFAQYSSLTASIIHGDYRNASPSVDLSRVGVRIVDEGGLPLASANVKIWSVTGAYPYQSQLLVDGSTDANGELYFAWGGSANAHNSYDFLRLVKVFKEGYTAAASYISIYDTDIARLVEGSSVFSREIALAKAGTPLAGIAFGDVSADNFASVWIARLYQAGITGGCSTTPLRYCPEQVVTRAQMAVFLERSMKGSSFTPAPVSGDVFADVPSAYWSAAWIKQLATDGITGGCGGGNYCPEAPVTRAQMAVFLLRAKYGAGYAPPAVGAGSGFADVTSGYWAAAWIKQLAAEDITGGCGGGNYCPDNPVTRAQMAVFLVKTFRLP